MSGSRLPDVREASVQYYVDADTLGSPTSWRAFGPM
jgi:hypothetical protein